MRNRPSSERQTPRVQGFDPRVLAGFKALLFDMNGTFMFGHDRFGDDVDYFKSYRALGGATLNAGMVNFMVRRFIEEMTRLYGDPAFQDDFPTAMETLRRLFPEAAPGQLTRIEQVVAHHELGHVPEDHLETLRALSRTHRLGLVTNIWSRKDRWLGAFQMLGLGHIPINRIPLEPEF